MHWGRGWSKQQNRVWSSKESYEKPKNTIMGKGIIIIIIISGSFHFSRTHVITQSTVSTNYCANVCIMLFVAIKTSHFKAHICLQPQISLLMSTMFAVVRWWPWDWLSEMHSIQASGCALGLSPHIPAASLKAFISVTWSRGRRKKLLHRRSCGFGKNGDRRLHFEKLWSKHSAGDCIHMHVACWQLGAVTVWALCKKHTKVKYSH